MDVKCNSVSNSISVFVVCVSSSIWCDASVTVGVNDIIGCVGGKGDEFDIVDVDSSPLAKFGVVSG